jgi:hypothetical protein
MPDWRRLIRHRLIAADLPPADEIGIVEELAQHVEDCYQDCCARGLSAEEAEAASLAEIDGQTLADGMRAARSQE